MSDNSKQGSFIINDNVVTVFLKFTIPNIFSFVAMSSSGLVDAIFIGNYVGGTALAAVNIVNPIFSFVIGISVLFISGGAVRAGKYIGENNIEQASAIFTKSVGIILLLSILISTILIIFAPFFTGLLGANDELKPLSSLYMRIVMSFAIFYTLGHALSVFIRVDGRPLFSSISMTSTAIINIFLTWLFVAKLGYGIIGAAFATSIAAMSSFIMLSSHFYLKKNKIFLTKNIGKLKELASAAYNGSSEFISETSSGIIMMTFNIIMMKNFGTDGVIAYTAIVYMFWAVIIVNLAISESMAPIVSINFGARQNKRMLQFLKIALIFSTVMGVTAFTLLTIYPKELIGMFVKDNLKALEIGVNYALGVRWAALISGYSIMLSAFFTAIQIPRESVIISSLRGLILPLIFINTFPLFFGHFGIFITSAFSEALTLLVGIYLWYLNKRKLSILSIKY